MQIHEYQAKVLLAEKGVPVPRGQLAASPAEARDAFDVLNAPAVAVKAQIHAGARGKAGGILLADSAREAEEAATQLLGKRLVTHQTGPAGLMVRKVWLEPAVEVAREFYLGIVLDRTAECPVIVASAEGGTSIEELAREAPEKLCRIPLDPTAGCRPFQARRVAEFLLGSAGAMAARGHAARLAAVVTALSEVFFDLHATLAEINPLVVTAEGDVLALDAKVDLDDDALYLNERLGELDDPDEPDGAEATARAAGLSYVQLDGSIGCVVNGAGLAMATMDLIHHHGGDPANFLDVGGGASEDRIRLAFDLLEGDPQVKVILVNIFGGIVHCDKVARAVIGASRAAQNPRPKVVRLEGTNVEQARQLLADSGLPFDVASDMDTAAQLAVERIRT